jgi:predicted aspartyl protease
MIIGIVNADFEPIIPLSICGSNGKVYTQEAIVDTGFNGWLSLPPDLIAELNLKWKRRGRAILGDGTECVFDVYEAVLVWDGNMLTPFQVFFAQQRSWKKAQSMLMGAILCRGKRRVSRVLTVMGLSPSKQYGKYYRVLSRVPNTKSE